MPFNNWYLKWNPVAGTNSITITMQSTTSSGRDPNTVKLLFRLLCSFFCLSKYPSYSNNTSLFVDAFTLLPPTNHFQSSVFLGPRVIKSSQALPSEPQMRILRSPPHEANRVPVGFQARNQHRESGCAETRLCSTSESFMAASSG